MTDIKVRHGGSAGASPTDQAHGLHIGSSS